MISLIIHIQEFIGAKHPTIPFTLRIEDCKNENDIIKAQILSNRKTNEELSISPNIEYEGWKGTEIKRTAKQKRNSKPKL